LRTVVPTLACHWSDRAAAWLEDLIV